MPAARVLGGELTTCGELSSDAKRLRQLETENARLKKLLAATLLEAEVSREALRRKW